MALIVPAGFFRDCKKATGLHYDVFRPGLHCRLGSDEVMAEQSKKMCVVGLCDTAANFRQFSSIDSDGIQRSNAQTNGLAYPIASLSKDL